MVRDIDRRTILKGTGAIGIAGVLAGCVGGDDDDDDDTDDDDTTPGDDVDPDEADARVGVLAPATGDLEDLGGPIQDAGVLPALQLEDEGVDFDIEIRREDTETDFATGVERAQAIADAGIPSINGASSSDVTIAVAQDVLFDEEVVGISPASTSPDITDLDGEFLMRLAPTDDLQGVAMADIAVDRFDASTAATFFLNDAYGQGLQDVFVREFENLGGEITAEVSFEPEEPSYDSELGTALEDDPDVLMMVGFPESGEQIFRDFYENFDGDTPIIVPDGLQDGGLPGSVDNPMANVIGTAPAAAGPGADFFAEEFEDEFGFEPSVFTAQSYDSTAIHILAQLRADELSGPVVAEQVREVTDPGGELITPENLADGLDLAADGEEIEYQGASGPAEFDENGDLAAAVYDVFEFDPDEGIVVIDTLET